MHKANLKEILEKIKQQRIDSQDSQNMLTTKKKEKIYHEIVKAMMEGENEYSFLKYGAEPVFQEQSLQRQIRDWLQNEHQIECIKKYVDITDYTNDNFYFVAIWN